MYAFGQLGLRAIVLTGQADTQVEEWGLDLVAIRGKVVDEFAGRVKALLNDLRVSLNVSALMCSSSDASMSQLSCLKLSALLSQRLSSAVSMGQLFYSTSQLFGSLDLFKNPLNAGVVVRRRTLASGVAAWCIPAPRYTKSA
jgi:predicted signal transduction protein with EAL and GGDEF domain